MADLSGGTPFSEDLPLVTYSGGAPSTDFSAETLFTTVYADKFLPLILPYCVQCPHPVAEQYVRLAAIEFCERTRAWRYIVTAEMDANNEAIIAPDYATIHEIENAWWNGDTQLEPTQFTEALPSDLTATDTVGTPSYITQMNPNTVTILPFAEGTLRLTVFLKPRSGTLYGTDAGLALRNYYNQVPEFLWVQHAEAIANGALARILNIPEQPYTDPVMAAQFRARFDAVLDAKFASNIRGQHRARKRSKIQFC